MEVAYLKPKAGQVCKHVMLSLRSSLLRLVSVPLDAMSNNSNQLVPMHYDLMIALIAAAVALIHMMAVHTLIAVIAVLAVIVVMLAMATSLHCLNVRIQYLEWLRSKAVEV